MNDLAKKRRDRGEVNETDVAHFALWGEQYLLLLLRSEIAVERSCAAIHLQKHQNWPVVTALCRQLAVEKCLYTRIALCETLVSCGELSSEPLMGLLGQIGNNQETTIPKRGFYKISYPLPRDLAARTICRLGSSVIQPLENLIRTSPAENEKALMQAIDAYGHIIYSHKLTCSSATLQEVYQKHPASDLLTYKITRCLSGIHDEWARSFLLKIIQMDNEGLRLEALRSLYLLKIEIPSTIQRSFSVEMQKLEAFLKKKLTK